MATTCYDGKVANTVGTEDPFYVNAWHLKNTGPTQVVSAVANNGLAGIDARVEAVHQGGVGCTGRGVTIAIVDSGLEIGHEDLRDNVLTGKSFNFATNLDDPSPATGQAKLDHGTGVGGVAGARGWNGKGSRGTAPLASLVGYPIVGVTAKAPTTDAAMTFLSFGARALAGIEAVVALFNTRADGVGIFNYSAGSDFAAPPVVVDDAPQELAGKYGTTNLRGGKGAVYFQAAGNEYSAMKGSLPDGSSLDVNCVDVLTADAAVLGGAIANLNGISCGNPNQEPGNKPYFYQVAAIHNTGKAASYSNSGASNWITGFGGEFGVNEVAIITTDDSGCASGQNNAANRDGLIAQIGAAISSLIADLFGTAPTKDPGCNYTGQMNGTSAATPSVSGVAALMLEANPQLTWRDVGYILAKTARKVDDTIADAASMPRFTATGAAAGWNLDMPWITNGAGFNFQNRYGFGLVDANEAVKLAATFATPAGRRTTDLVTTNGSAATTAKLNGAGVNTATASFADPTAIGGAMRVDLTITNNAGASINPGMLQFEITNTKTNTRSILLPAFTSWYAGGKTNEVPPLGVQKFRFHTNAFYGEALDGTFQVRVIDLSNKSGDAGKVLDFRPVLTSFSL